MYAKVTIAFNCWMICTMALAQTPGQPFEERIPSSLVKFKMIWIPKTPSSMGIGDFWIMETEVTWDLYDHWAFRFDMTPEQESSGIDAESRPTKPYGAPDRGFGHAGYPALGVTYHAAQEFCKWLSKITGKKYRLPTVSEWRHAAIANQSVSPNVQEIAWVWENANDKTHKVASKAPNGWQLYDMLGNVAEWCQDKDGAVVCGGSYVDKESVVNFDRKVAPSPAWNQTDPQIPKSKWWLSDAPFVGFRVVCDP